METNNEQQQEFYTLEGLDKLYTDFRSAQIEAKSKGREKEVPLRFLSEETAEALRTGNWNEYFKKNLTKFETDKDAVVYADGSYSAAEGKEPIGSYGVVIFFKNGETFCESALLQDDENEKKYHITRYNENGDISGEAEENYEDICKEGGYIKASYQIGGECEGVMRALSLCQNKQLKKIVLCYDCEAIETQYRNGKERSGSNVTYKYGSFCDEISTAGMEVEFCKIVSHKHYLITDKDYQHAVFNDVVDILAKAAVGDKKISRSKETGNPNVVRAITNKFQTFWEAGETERSREENAPARRKHAGKIYGEVMSHEELWPCFKQDL